jgi:hypothetical protein
MTPLQRLQLSPIIQYGGRRIEKLLHACMVLSHTYDKPNSPCVTQTKYILIVIPMFSGWKNLMALSGMFFRFDIEIGGENVKMAVA